MTRLSSVSRGITLVQSPSELRHHISNWRSQGLTIGFVPTMGALHDGHLALVKNSQKENDRTIVSVFVNPKQFDRKEDLEKYPLDIEKDKALLDKENVEIVYAPDVQDIYPDGFSTSVHVKGISEELEGAERRGHFQGVTTIVAKLLCQVLPDKAYFGEKDYQQVCVIKRMVMDLDIPVQIIPVSTVRESNGLALSSRNVLLSSYEKTIAPQIYSTLQEIAAELKKGKKIDTLVPQAIQKLARAGFGQIDYIELRASDTLERLAHPSRPSRLFIAAWLGKVRLIDNIPILPLNT